MMFDGFKILNLPVNIDKLKKNELLSFIHNFKDKDGDILTSIAEYNGIKFTIQYINNKKVNIKGETIIKDNNNVILKGSFHKYFNNGLHNHNDFTFSDLINTIFDLCTKFKIDPKKTLLNNLEFGVNVYIPVEPEEVFKNIVNYKGNTFHKFNIDNSKGIECKLQNFIIKIYDKSYQYKQSGNLLRFEIKVIKMQYFTDNKINIKTIYDLLDIKTIYPLKDILTRVFNEILFTDYNISKDKLTAKELLIFSEGNNPKYWEQLIPKSKLTDNSENKDYNKQRKKYYRELTNFKNIILKYSTTNLQNDISILINEKCIQLLKTEIKKRDKLTVISKNKKISKKGQINILNIVVNCPVLPVQKNRYCLTCKNDISEKKLNAKFCSKKCKNDFTNPLLNPRNNLLKSINNLNSYPVLFDNSKYIQLPGEKLELLRKPNSIYN